MPRTDWTPVTKSATDWSPSTKNATAWQVGQVFSLYALLLQDGLSFLLLQNGLNNLGFEQDT